MGRGMSVALRTAGAAVSGPHPRGFAGDGSEAVLLCVPDDRIAAAAALLVEGPFVGHCAGALPLSVLATVPPERRFSVHPLITATTARAVFTGASAAVAGGSRGARAVASTIAVTAGMRPFVLDETDRAAYHAGAAMAANFLVTVQWAAARLLTTAGVPPTAVLPLARQALAAWSELGPDALTGPVARGDVGTVAAHRSAVADRTPDLLPLFDELVRATERLASREETP